MAQITIGGSFNVNIVEDGAQGSPAPFYREQFYAWSESISTASNTTPPSDISAWTVYVPSKVSGKPYLWLKDIPYSYEGTAYVAGQTTYTCISGENGTGIQVKGSVATVGDLPSSASVGDSYYVDANGHLYVWSGSAWIDVGEIKGEPGLSSFVHVAWAHGVGSSGYPEDGMGFTTSKAAGENYEYMGVYTDNTSADSQTPSDYAWNKIKGEGNVVLDLDNEMDSILYDGLGNKISGNVVSNAQLYVGGTPQNTNVTYSLASISTGITASISGKVVTVTQATQSGYVMVQAAFQGVNYQAKLTVKRIENGDKYDIIATPNSVPYNITDDVPATSSVRINIQRSAVDGVAYLNDLPTNYSLTVRARVANNATEYSVSVSHTAETDSWTFLTDNSAYDEYIIRLLYGNDVVDSETIPITKATNGEDGENGIDVTVNPNPVVIRTTSDNKVKSSGYFDLNVRAYIGGEPLYFDEESISQSISYDSAVSAGNEPYVFSQCDCETYGREKFEVTYSKRVGKQFVGGVIAFSASAYKNYALTGDQYTVRAFITVAEAPDGQNGESTIFLDIDNEMDAMIYSDLATKVTQSVRTTARLYDGITDKTANVTSWTATANGVTTGSSQSSNVFIVDGVTAATEGTLTINASYGGKIYTKVFTVKKLVNQSKFMFEVSPNALTYNETGENFSSSTITAKVREITPSGGSSLVTSYGTDYEMHMSIEYAGEPSSQESVSSDVVNGVLTLDNLDEEAVSYTFYFYKKRIGASGYDLMDMETIPIARVSDGNNGQDSIYADLTNDMDAIALTSEGTVDGAQSVSTEVRIYKGSTAQTITSCTIPQSGGGITYTKTNITSTTKVCTVTVAIADGTALTGNHLTVPISLACSVNGQSVSRTVNLNIKGVMAGMDGQNAVIYKIVPSDTAVKVDSDGDRIPQSITCTKGKRVGNGSYAPTTDGYLTYQVDDEAEQVYTTSVDTESANTRIIFRLYDDTNKTNLLDAETIPVLADGVDGEDGKDAVFYHINMIDATAYVDTEERVYFSLVWQVVKNEGGVDTIISPVRIGTGDNKIGCQVNINEEDSAWSNNVTVNTTTKEFSFINNDGPYHESSIGISIRFVDTTDANNIKVIATHFVPFNFFGKDGATGAAGGSAIYLDIDNEYDALQYTESGTCVSAPVTSTAVLYQGGQVVNGGTWGTLQTSHCTATRSGGKITVSAIESGYSEGRVTITKTYNGVGYSKVFTVSRLVNQDKFVLRLSATSVSYNATTGVKTPSTVNVKVLRERMTSSMTIEQTELSSLTADGLTLYMQTMSNGTLGTESDITASYNSGGQYSLSVDAGYDAYYFTLKRGDSLCDYETLGITKAQNGAKGADGVYFDIEASFGSLIAEQGSSTVSTPASSTAKFYKWTNGVKAAYSAHWAIYLRQDNGTYLYQLAKSSAKTTSCSLAGFTVYVDGQNSHLANAKSSAIVVFVNDSAFAGNYNNSQVPPNIAMEEIPVLKNGADGTVPDIYRIEVTDSSLSVNSSGYLNGSVKWKVWKNSNGTETQFTSNSSCKLNTDGSWENMSTTNVFAKTFTNKAVTSSTTQFLIRVVVSSNTVANAEVPITVTGRMGRNYYYAGEWSANVTYTATDYLAPFVSLEVNNQTGYWMMVGENRSISGNGHKPSDVSTDWEAFTTSFKYLITEALFTDFAKLGSAVFNSDYMFSQHGYMVGFNGSKVVVNDGTQYQYLDPDDLDGSNIGNEEYPPHAQTSTLPFYENSRGKAPEQFDTPYYITGTELEAGRYYAIEIDVESEAIGDDTATIKVRKGQSFVFSKDFTVPNNAYVEQKLCVVFKCESTGYHEFGIFSAYSESRFCVHYSFYREAKFVPNLIMNLMTGQMVANNLVARGMLYAASVGYKAGRTTQENERYYVNEESIIIVSSVGAVILLPNPDECNGRRIEIRKYTNGSSANYHMGQQGGGHDMRLASNWSTFTPSTPTNTPANSQFGTEKLTAVSCKSPDGDYYEWLILE